MASISEKIANNIVKNNGVYVTDDGERDPQCFAVFKIKNSNFGHVHECVAYSESELFRYAEFHNVVEILWSLRPLDLKQVNLRQKS